MPASRDPVASQIELFEDTVEKIPDINESVKKSLTNTLKNKARISLAREDDKSKISQLIKSQALPAEETASPMPWDKLTETETKIISKIIENLKEQDFSTKSLKIWSAHFSDVYDKFFVTSRVGRIAVVYNSCSLSLKQRLLALDVGKEARKDSYSYLKLLQFISTVVHSPISCDQAMMEIYKGLRQTNSETVQTYLQRWCDVAEDAWGPSSGWTMSQASLLLKKICDGFNSTEIAKLTASIVISVPFQWTTLCDSVLQFQQRVKNTHPEQNVNAIQQKEAKSVVCYRCSAAHYMRDCRTLVCRYCSQNHKHSDCAKYGQKTYCVKCKSKFHNEEGHFRFAPANQKPRRSDINLIEATSFLEGAISMDMDCTGKNFENTKILIDTGALIPTGVAISEYFFFNNLRGKIEDLIPSELDSVQYNCWDFHTNNMDHLLDTTNFILYSASVFGILEYMFIYLD